MLKLAGGAVKFVGAIDKCVKSGYGRTSWSVLCDELDRERTKCRKRGNEADLPKEALDSQMFISVQLVTAIRCWWKKMITECEE